MWNLDYKYIYIQIQHLLKLNEHTSDASTNSKLNSNTTLVKVKYGGQISLSKDY